MGHHHHHHEHTSTKNLKLAFWVNFLFAIFEIFGGLYVNSVAIISDAIHDLGDSFSLGGAYFLEKFSKKKADKRYSFGYGRYSLLSALLNSVILVTGSVFVVYESILRIIHPESSDALGMVVFAFFGIAINGIVMLRLHSSRTLNEKVVYWHMMEDVLGWVAVLIAALIMLVYPSPYIDPILSLLITSYILYGVIKRLKETLYFFLQGVPEELDLDGLKEEILAVPCIASIHDVHVWTLDGDHHVYTAHITLKNIDSFDQICETKNKVKTILEEHHFKYYTIETELDNERCTFR
ncbi:MAG: cation transporter [Brumimicrobium sp.]|nr:cation transporter [Brumimicrobium sp.]MCO5269336.1 cation diffusion facilitator family transporter [Brumimicrobium sp.]